MGNTRKRLEDPENLTWLIECSKKSYKTLNGPGAKDGDYKKYNLWKTPITEIAKMQLSEFAFDVAFGFPINLMKRRHGSYDVRIQLLAGTLKAPEPLPGFGRAVRTSGYFTSGGELTLEDQAVVTQLERAARQLHPEPLLLKLELLSKYQGAAHSPG